MCVNSSATGPYKLVYKPVNTCSYWLSPFSRLIEWLGPGGSCSGNKSSVVGSPLAETEGAADTGLHTAGLVAAGLSLDLSDLFYKESKYRKTVIHFMSHLLRILCFKGLKISLNFSL